MFTLDRENLIGSGFIRENCTNDSISVDIVQLCCNYFSEATPWHFEGNQLRKLLSSPPRTIVYSSTKNNIIIDNVTFSAEICPMNGFGLVSFRLKLLSMPDNIASITVYYELYCREMQIKFNNIFGFAQINSIFEWNNTIIPLSICQTKKRLNFIYFIKILRFNYYTFDQYTHNIIKKAMKPIYISNQIKWNVQNIDNNIKNGNYLFAENKADINWQIFCAPNGRYKNESGKFFLGIQLLSLPYGVLSIYCSIVTELEYTGIKWKNTYQFGIDIKKKQFSRWAIKYGLFKSFCKKSKLPFCVTINILSAKSINGLSIPQAEWKSFGIIKDWTEYDSYSCYATSRMEENEFKRRTNEAKRRSLPLPVTNNINITNGIGNYIQAPQHYYYTSNPTPQSFVDTSQYQ